MDPTLTNTENQAWPRAIDRMLKLLKRDMKNHELLGDPWQKAARNMVHTHFNMQHRRRRPRVNRKHQPPTTWNKAVTSMIQRLKSRSETRMSSGTWTQRVNQWVAAPHHWLEGSIAAQRDSATR